jgi:N-acyl amino acid synthase of PEP-CTERM/exosortase system
MPEFDEAWIERDGRNPYFDFVRIPCRGKDAAPALDDLYMLRYEVYCIECAFLDPACYENGKESDEYDDCSMHFGAYARDRMLVGTVRLVQPPKDMAYPFMAHCEVFDRFALPPRVEAAEISRLVVKKTYRRRRGDSLQGISKDFLSGETPPESTIAAGQIDRRTDTPLLLLGLYREMYRYSCENGIRYWYAAMERSLARALERMGFKFEPIGPPTDYYGKVTPYVVDLHELRERVGKDNAVFMAWLNK